jgi:hypothetical protein
VLAGIAHEVGEREAVVHGDVIDRRARAPAVMIEQIGRAGHAAGDVADQLAGTAPVVPQRAAAVIVPLRPARRKMADLIAAGADVPGLGDQLDGGKDRILFDRRKKGGARVEAVVSAAERGGKIEPEPST